MATAPTPNLFDRLLPDRLVGWLSLAMLAAVLAAVARGQPHWAEASPAVWAHLALLVLVLVITPLQLWGVKGSRQHRILGWAWSVAMLATALVSLSIRQVNDGGFSWIHLISLFVIVQVPLLVWSARHHNVKRHRDKARGLTIFALGVAGFFTFPFGRMLGRWLLG